MCFAFLAFNTRPASLSIGKGGRLAIGYTVAVGALAVRPATAPAGSVGVLVIPVMLTGVLVADGLVVLWGRLRRRRRLTTARTTISCIGLTAAGWRRGEAQALLLVAQTVLSILAVITAREVLPLWLGAAIAVADLTVLVGEGTRRGTERTRPAGLPAPSPRTFARDRRPGGCRAPARVRREGAADLMERGREAAARGLSAAAPGTPSWRRAPSDRRR